MNSLGTGGRDCSHVAIARSSAGIIVGWRIAAVWRDHYSYFPKPECAGFSFCVASLSVELRTLVARPIPTHRYDNT